MPQNNKKKLSCFSQTTHLPKPDYTKATFNLSPEKYKKIKNRLTSLYSHKIAEKYMPELERILKVYYAHKTDQIIEDDKNFKPENRFTEQDIILITYGNIINGSEGSALKTLEKFCDNYLGGNINTLHLLPFFPYSSDRGFAIIDFESVDPTCGSWDDINSLENCYQLMFDGVFNHVSSKNRWFQEFLNRNPQYKDFFLSYNSNNKIKKQDLEIIFRPRTSDLLTKFHTLNGIRYVWTTFSEDQVDLNYKNPEVLMQVISILLMYVRKGADIIRLDAVTYWWHEIGTTCVNLKQTHELVKFFRDILNAVAPRVALITETNVPHKENISYFGNGRDEAQMVYNFALPPLVLHTFYTADSKTLSDWAASLKLKSKTTTFFNFLDSHDGIGLSAVKDILSPEEINFIIKKAEENEGYISYKKSKNEKEEPYEINITWYNALNSENNPNEDLILQVKRFIASRAIALVLQGVPGIYLHGLLGISNDHLQVTETHLKRDINRTIIYYEAISNALQDKKSRAFLINQELNKLMGIRIKQTAFHPNSCQKILYISPQVFIVLRTSSDKKSILTITNISNQDSQIRIPIDDLPSSNWFNLLDNTTEIKAEKNYLKMQLKPYDLVWLKNKN